jgi:hypothetical protein
MNDTQSFDIRIPVRVMTEAHAGEKDACDVIVEMEDGAIYTAMFVTFQYLQRQMTLTHDLTAQIDDAVPVRFAMLETPHIILESLNRETIEDCIDSLFAMETFGTIFTQVTEDETESSHDDTTTTNGNGRRATQEMAAVVLSDVLVVEE